MRPYLCYVLLFNLFDLLDLHPFVPVSIILVFIPILRPFSLFSHQLPTVFSFYLVAYAVRFSSFSRGTTSDTGPPEEEPSHAFRLLRLDQQNPIATAPATGPPPYGMD